MDGSPPSSHHNNRDPILHRQDWELLSASTLLTQSHILGLGLGLGLGREDGDGSSGPTSRDSGNSVDETNPSFLSFSGVYGRSSLPVDMSQISAMYNSSTSASASVLEPFTEGWEPQFRIAGAPLQEDYYGREDPFVVLDSNLGLQRHRHQNEPFLVMEQTFLAEPDSIVIAEKEEKASSLRDSNSLRKQREAEEFGAEKGLNDDDDEEDEEEDDDDDEDEYEYEDGLLLAIRLLTLSRIWIEHKRKRSRATERD